MAATVSGTLLTWRWLLLTAAVLAAIVAMITLGVWQWQRSAPPDVADRAAAEARTADVSVLPAVTEIVDASGVSGGADRDDVGRLVRVEGRWRHDLTLLVADREPPDAPRGDIAAGGTGRWVVTPVELTGGDLLVPVVRGWVPTGGDDPEDGPVVAPAIAGPARLAGWLQVSEGLDLPADPLQPEGVVPLLSSADLVNRWPGELVRGFVVAARSEEPAGSPVVPLAAPPEDASTEPRDWRNVAYSVQWYVFAGFAVVLWWRMLRDDVRHGPARPGRAASGEDGDRPATEPAGTGGSRT